VTVTIGSLNEEKERFESAVAKFESERAAMFGPDGKRIWADGPHEERLVKLFEPVKRCAHYLEEEVGTALAEAEAADVLRHADPLASLTDSELSRAYHLKPFVESSVNAMSLAELGPRLAAIIATGSRSEVACYHQAAQKRVEVLTEAARGKASLDDTQGGNSQIDLTGISAVSQHLKTLSDKLVDPKIAKRLADTEALRKTALEVKRATVAKLSQVDGTAAKAKADSFAAAAADF